MGNIGVKGMEMENIGATELGTRNEKEREWKEWKQKGLWLMGDGTKGFDENYSLLGKASTGEKKTFLTLSKSW